MLSARQAALLERVCLRRYTVVFEHYMGSHRPNESVRVDARDGSTDRSFRPMTAESLRAKGLVRYVSQGQGWSHVMPTQAGLDRFRADTASNADRPGQSPAGETHKVQGRTP